MPAQTEALVRMGVVNNLDPPPQNGKILVAATQDFLTYAFLITGKKKVRAASCSVLPERYPRRCLADGAPMRCRPLAVVHACRANAVQGQHPRCAGPH